VRTRLVVVGCERSVVGKVVLEERSELEGKGHYIYRRPEVNLQQGLSTRRVSPRQRRMPWPRPISRHLGTI
jgi:hypothetical protein